MSAALVAPYIRAFAPDFARRFALITAGLIAAIARVFLRDPRLVPFTIPLYRRMARATRRCTGLMTLLAAGKTLRRHQPGHSGPHTPTTHTPNTRIPTAEAWLIQNLRHEAAGYASQLAHLLAEPTAVELLATIPAASHVLRPICRLLGLRHVAQRSGIDSDPATGAQLCVPKAAAEAPLPATATLSCCESRASRERSLPPEKPRSPPAPPLPAPVLSPWTHVGFPWLPWPDAKPT